MTSVRVLAVGSPHGDDRVGWQVGRRLEACWRGDPRVQVRCLDRPGADLVRHLEGADVALIVDALRSRAPAGHAVEVDPEQLDGGAAGISSHGLGVVRALELAAALGSMPRDVRVLGITVGADPDPVTMGPEVSAAVPVATREANRLMAGLGLRPAAAAPP